MKFQPYYLITDNNYRIAASSFPLFPFNHPERIHPAHLQIFKRQRWMSEGSPGSKQKFQK
jgi:hypothetical protein